MPLGSRGADGTCLFSVRLGRDNCGDITIGRAAVRWRG